MSSTPKDLHEYVETKEWEGKDRLGRDVVSKLDNDRGKTDKIVQRFAEFRQKGTVLLSHRFWDKLSPVMSSFIESAKVSAIGPWNMYNDNNGEKSAAAVFGLDQTQLSIVGAYLIYEEFHEYRKLFDAGHLFKIVNLGEDKIASRTDEDLSVLCVKKGTTVNELLEQIKKMKLKGSDRLDFKIEHTPEPSDKRKRKVDEVYNSMEQ